MPNALEAALIQGFRIHIRCLDKIVEVHTTKTGHVFNGEREACHRVCAPDLVVALQHLNEMLRQGGRTTVHEVADRCKVAECTACTWLAEGGTITFDRFGSLVLLVAQKEGDQRRTHHVVMGSSIQEALGRMIELPKGVDIYARPPK